MAKSEDTFLRRWNLLASIPRAPVAIDLGDDRRCTRERGDRDDPVDGRQGSRGPGGVVPVAPRRAIGSTALVVDERRALLAVPGARCGRRDRARRGDAASACGVPARRARVARPDDGERARRSRRRGRTRARASLGAARRSAGGRADRTGSGAPRDPRTARARFAVPADRARGGAARRRSVRARRARRAALPRRGNRGRGEAGHPRAPQDCSRDAPRSRRERPRGARPRRLPARGCAGVVGCGLDRFSSCASSRRLAQRSSTRGWTGPTS